MTFTGAIVHIDSDVFIDNPKDEVDACLKALDLMRQSITDPDLGPHIVFHILWQGRMDQPEIVIDGQVQGE